jgi:hypothetical protein
MISIISLALLFGFVFMLFFIIKKQIRKVKYFKERKTATNLTSALLSLSLYSMLSIFLTLYLTRVPQRKFDKTTWINNVNDRYKMIDDLVQSDYLIGKDKDFLKNLFGKPLRIDTENKVIEYELIGRKWSDFRIIKLKLYIKNDIVHRFEYSE